MWKRLKRSFKDYLKNLALFHEEAREMEEADRAAPPTERELAALVSAIGNRQLEYEELQKLKKAGDKVVPLLLNALRNEAFLFQRYGKSVVDGSAIETALDLLEPFALPEVVLLGPALRHPDEFFRYHALYHLARCGNDDAVEALKAGLKEEAEECRTWTLMGLGFLKKSRRGSKKFRAALFDAVLPLLEDEEFDAAEQAPHALLALDFERAKDVLLGKVVFRPDNERIHDVLKALRENQALVPPSQLRDLLAGLKNKAKEFPFDHAYADGLILLARAEGARAKDLIADAQGWGNKEVKEGAAIATEIAAGVTDAYGFVWDLYEGKGANGLSKPQLYYLTLWQLDAEVCNGGFSQYYFNSSGDLAAYAVEAAKAVGSAELAGIIHNANALFGKKGPDPDRQKRMEQLSKIDLKALEKLDAGYYECFDRLSELLPRFVASNTEAFKSVK